MFVFFNEKRWTQLLLKQSEFREMKRSKLLLHMCINQLQKLLVTSFHLEEEKESTLMASPYMRRLAGRNNNDRDSRTSGNSKTL